MYWGFCRNIVFAKKKRLQQKVNLIDLSAFGFHVAYGRYFVEINTGLQSFIFVFYTTKVVQNIVQISEYIEDSKDTLLKRE